jgi:hypothetical protein
MNLLVELWEIFIVVSSSSCVVHDFFLLKRSNNTIILTWQIRIGIKVSSRKAG